MEVLIEVVNPDGPSSSLKSFDISGLKTPPIHNFSDVVLNNSEGLCYLFKLL